jgi:hypothetical protein
MVKRPQPLCLALLVCDAVVTDRNTDKISILGTFSEILADGLPVLVPQLTVYAELTNGHGETTVQLRLSRVEPKPVEAAGDILGQTLGLWEFPIVFDSPLRIYNLHITAMNLYLLDFGDYRFSVEVEGEIILERCISLALRRRP